MAAVHGTSGHGGKAGIRLIALAVVAVVVVVALVVLFLQQQNPPAPSGGSSSIPSQSGGPGGPGQSFMSESEMRSLFGPGPYSASGSQNASKLGALISAYPSATQQFLKNNVTSYWSAGWNVSSTGGTGPDATEWAVASPVPGYVYNSMLQSIFTVGNFGMTAHNSSLDGMTYSYGTDQLGTTYLVGVKDSEVTVVTVYGMRVDAGSLAAIVAGDMP